MAARVVLGLGLAISIALNALWAFRDEAGLRDYGSFLVSGKAQDLGLNPFAIHTGDFGPDLRVFRAQVGDWQADSVNLNPPISVYAFRYLAALDARDGMLATAIGSLALFGALLGVLLQANPRHANVLAILALANLAAIWHVVELGQIYVLLLAGLVGAWFSFKRGHSALAGLFLGLVAAVKPPFVVIALILLFAGHRRSGITAVAIMAAISSVLLLLDGAQIYEQWLTASRELAPVLTIGPGNSSLAGAASRVTDPVFGTAAAAALVAGAMWLCYRQRPDPAACFSLGAAAVLLLGPLAWAGYGLFLLPILLSWRWKAWEYAAVAILNVPVWLILDAFPSDTGELLLGSVHFWAFAIVFVLVVRDIRNSSQPVPDATQSSQLRFGEPGLQRLRQNP